MEKFESTAILLLVTASLAPAAPPPSAVRALTSDKVAASVAGVTVNGKEWTEFNKDKETITLKGLTGTVTLTATY